MKVLAINSSPKMGNGNTALILTPFLEGMREARAEVELLYTKSLEINPCQGCYSCWFKTPGNCFQKDDMQMLHPKLREADIWVFATPVYWRGVSGPMKNLMDRMSPLLQPFLELRDGWWRLALREGTKHGKVVLVSNGGDWGMDSFDLLLAYMKSFSTDAGREFGGALLRPNGDFLKPMMEMGEQVDDIFKAAKEAGRQIVREGKMSAETLATVSRELMPLETYIQDYNQWAQEELDALEKKEKKQ